ncbi:MAG: NAD(P)-dependent oxidoreductase [Myxococcales bacterium]|nr:NAD(P)-dependent oxidoreductase [Myxococcales bacterium]
MGSAISRVFGDDHEIIGMNRNHLDCENLDQVSAVVAAERPDLVINAVAFLGIDACESEADRAIQLNTLLPKRLAELSRDRGFVFAHLSTDAVFGDALDKYCVESDPVKPFNVYGLTKYGGDYFVQSIARRSYLFRLPVLFGESSKRDQFVEKMLSRVQAGERRLQISSDIITTPSYSRDIAEEMHRILASDLPPDLYHLTNEGRGSLFEMIELLVANLRLAVTVEPVSHKRFPSFGRKNVFTTMKSEKVTSLRPWRDAFREYCETLQAQVGTIETSSTQPERRVRKKWSSSSMNQGSPI